MLFIVTLTHSPELCLARDEFAPSYKAWAGEMKDRVRELGIRVMGAYACPNEHTLWFILDAKDLSAVTAFFSGVMLTHHTGRVSAVIPLQEAADILMK